MKKYITTSEHPQLKEGIEFVMDQTVGEYCAIINYEKNCVKTIYFSIDALNGMVKLGWLKEQEPKWFDSDMIDFIKHWVWEDSEDKMDNSLDREINRSFEKFKASRA